MVSDGRVPAVEFPGGDTDIKLHAYRVRKVSYQYSMGRCSVTLYYVY